jgi:hypothetical protein
MVHVYPFWGVSSRRVWVGTTRRSRGGVKILVCVAYICSMDGLFGRDGSNFLYRLVPFCTALLQPGTTFGT